MQKFTLLLLLAIVATVFQVHGQDTDNVERIFEKVVNSKNGPVQGVIRQSRNPSVEYVSFLGIRYANSPPRFEPAKALDETWTTPKVAKTPGSICLQQIFGGTEDCLFLNVNVPKSHLEDASKKPLPVMFWIHGGGFGLGEGHTYGGECLLENENIILVTINYRLGVLGFFSMEDDDVFTANNGLRDIVLALKWVQENIAAFGGDPNSVTLSGESAGSAAVHYLLMSPLTKGLFHRAIMQSGAFGFWGYAENPRKTAVKFVTALGCENTDNAAEIRKCLENTSGDKLIKTQDTFSPRWPPNNPIPRFLPTAKEPQDNPFFSAKPSTFYTSPGGKTHYPNNVPVLLGVTREEGSTLFTTMILAIDGLFEKLGENWNDIVPEMVGYKDIFPEDKLAEISEKLRDYYYGNSSVTTDNLMPLVKLYSDSLMTLPVFQAAKDMAENGLTAYPYIFSYYGKHYGLEKFGAGRIPDLVGHADDLVYLFLHPLFSSPLEPGSEDENFSKNLVKLWTDFVNTGVPSKNWDHKSVLSWNAVTTENSSIPDWTLVELDTNPRTLSSKGIQERLTFWKTMFEDVWNFEEKKEAHTKTEL